jgi:MFS transporter, PPP family, 3-phenylpropionic acid transporter
LIQTADRRRLYVGIGALFFVYFTYVGLFSPYLALYLAGIGFPIAQIGWLMAVPQALRIVAPPFWGWLTDRSGNPRAVLAATSACACVAAIAVNLVFLDTAPAGDAAAGRFVTMFLLLSLLFFFTAAQVPVSEALAIGAVGGDAGAYGRLRIWGSIGFIVGVVAIGAVFDRFGTASLPAWVAGLLAVLALVAWRMPAARVDRAGRVSTPIRGRLRETRIAAFFVSAFLMIFAHAALYAFLSLHLEAKGYSKFVIGLLWALGVLAEIAVFWIQKGLFTRFGAERLLLASFAIAALRFVLIGAAAQWPAVLLLAQLMHAATFGVHHSATVTLLQRWFEPAQQGRAQALYAMIGYGLGGSAGVLVASRVWQSWSPEAAFIVAAVAAALGWIVLKFARVDARS